MLTIDPTTVSKTTASTIAGRVLAFAATLLFSKMRKSNEAKKAKKAKNRRPQNARRRAR